MPEMVHPELPTYTNDQSSYMRQMYEWHTKMAQVHEEQRKYHIERAQQFQQLMGGVVRPMSYGVPRRPKAKAR